MSMRWIYQTVLRLYPAEYHVAFAQEMLETFEQASKDCRERGRVARASFAVRELSGLLRGMFSEWKAKRKDQEAYMTAGCSSRRHADVPPDVAKLQNLLGRIIRCMESAIARHDFPKARFYAQAERMTRARLQALVEIRNSDA